MKTLINIPENIVQKKFNSSKIILAASLAIITIALWYGISVVEFEKNSAISALLVTLASALAIALCIVAFTLKHSVYKQTSSPFMSKTIEFHETQYSKVKGIIQRGEWVELKSLAKEGEGAMMRLEILYTKDREYVAYQFFRYLAYSFEEHSELFVARDEEVSKLTAL